MRVRINTGRAKIGLGAARATLGLAVFLLLISVVDASQRTEKFWTDLFRKYEGESLVCLHDNVVVDVEYTGDVQRRDISDTDRGGIQVDRSAELALGSKYTTINRYTKKFAVLDEAGAAAMREYVVPFWSGQVVARHSVEVVDRDGKKLEFEDEIIRIRPAYPNEAEIYHRIKDLVFRFSDLPVPCVVVMKYTIEGEEAFGVQDRVFAVAAPTYRFEMQYNFPSAYQMQNAAWWNNSLRSLRVTNPDQQTVASAKGEVNQWYWNYKNLKPSVQEPFSAPIVNLAPRVVYSPNFEANWEKLLKWYSEGVDQVVTRGGSDRVLRGRAREALDNFKEAKKAEIERLAAEAAATMALTDTLGEDLEGEEIEFIDETAMDDTLGETMAEAEEAASEIEVGSLTELEKVAAVYRYVQENFEVIDIPLGRGGYIPNRPVDVVELERIATKDLALILVGMLRIAKIEADFAVISTVAHGNPQTDYPSLTQFDRAIVVATVDGENYFLDPTEKVAGIADPPADLEGQFALPIKEGEPQWISIPIYPSGRNSWQADGEIVFDETEGTYKKEVSFECRGELNLLFRDKFYGSGREAGEEAKRVWIENNLPENAIVRDWEEDRRFKNDENYRFSFDVSFPEGLVEERGDSLILSGALFGSGTPVQLFDVEAEGRVNPIRLHFKESGKEFTRLVVPEGYYVTGLPDDVRFRLPFGIVEMRFEHWQSDNTIEYTMEYDLGESELAKEKAKDLKELFSQFRLTAERKIVLLKKAEEEEAL